MRNHFKTEYLVCLDISKNVNYVVGRSPTREGANKIARKARGVFPGDKIYLTKEMVLKQDLFAGKSPVSVLKGGMVGRRGKVAANPDSEKCKCGKKVGQCVGSLGCQCNPVALCKKADKWQLNPLEDGSADEAEELDELDELEGDEDYQDNPDEIIDEEELEEEYASNPDDSEEDEEDEEDEDDEDDSDEEDEEDDYESNPSEFEDDDEDDVELEDDDIEFEDDDED